ncbi:putative ATP-dependent RNA helicase DHX57 [Anthonomus grandis grandis]|uniref:putative ATP-dependent RNA helicase DHX57 n=1 Tax=Anthonomus grandis grandis TaxID=2921223 RepID=UPI0021665206|nr:putative ATP-dependent RNA helicase DHX57 [Anthonomus grandis grandis]
MDSEEAINAADFLLRENISAKVSTTKVTTKPTVVKQELQFLRLPDSIQEQILDTLKYIHGPDFKLGSISAYEDTKSNLLKKYWVGRGNLVVKGGCDYSQIKEGSSEEEERLKMFALMRLQSYGFHENHCIEAFQYCDNCVEDALYLLYTKYLKVTEKEPVVHDLTDIDLTDMRIDEKSSLESIYESAFSEKVEGVWIINLKIDYLFNMFHKKAQPKKIIQPDKKPKEKCKNFLRGQPCKFGNKCRFSHEPLPVENTDNNHLTSHYFELEFRFPKRSKYPYEPPLIFLKSDVCLPPLMSLHICKKLYQEAEILALDGIPSVYSVTELLKNEQEMTEHLKGDIEFIDYRQKLFSGEKILENRKLLPKHYRKGVTNRDKKKQMTSEEIRIEDERIIRAFEKRKSDLSYKVMLKARQNLPAWTLKNDILNTIRQFQVVVISGETGCGKSTQVPQFILDEWISAADYRHLEIVCTQPRRISAIGVAERVAEERIERIGASVGYQIRLESKISASTRLTFCTTGILLRRLEGEPSLPNVTHIIVDEVHERSEESDFLLLILKELLPLRPDLKVILMSATLNANLFSQYFGEIPVISIPGRTFPVEQYFLEDILEETGYVLEDGSEYCRKIKNDQEYVEAMMAEYDLSVDKPRDNIKDENLSVRQMMARYEGFSIRTCKNLFLMDSDKINNDLIENVLMWIVSGKHNYPKTGTILIFLPGIGEITALYDQLVVHEEFGKRKGKYIILPLHSSLTSEEQAAIFRKPRNKERKIVISTNLAETSVTIDDCVFVIDSGKMKEKHFDSNRNMESLETVWVTQANALQRKGRAGRVMPGVCVHLYTRHRFKHYFLHQPIPEIHRIPLEQLVLNIKVLPGFYERDVCDVLGSFIEPPTVENILSAIKRLESVGALDKEENLTPLGHHLAALPVDVRIGKLMLYGSMFGCVDAALTMAACLSYKSPFVSPFGKRDQANAKKLSFSAGFSDQVTALIAYRKYLSLAKKSAAAARNFANENYLSYKTLQTIADIKYQFLELLVDIGFVPVNLTGKRRRTGDDVVTDVTGSDFNVNGENVRLLASILCAALYPNIVKILTPSKTFIQSAVGAVPKENEAKDIRFATPKEMVFMHPSSVNYTIKSFPSPYMVYQEKVRTSKIFFRDCTMVPIVPLVLFSGDLDIVVQNGSTFLTLEDGWILFQVEEHKVAEMIKMIRIELYNLLEEKIRDPLLNLLHNDHGERVISAILKLVNL